MTNRAPRYEIFFFFFRKSYPNPFSIFIQIDRLHSTAMHTKVITFLGRHLERLSAKSAETGVTVGFWEKWNCNWEHRVPRIAHIFSRLDRLNANKSLFVMLENCIDSCIIFSYRIFNNWNKYNYNIFYKHFFQ